MGYNEFVLKETICVISNYSDFVSILTTYDLVIIMLLVELYVESLSYIFEFMKFVMKSLKPNSGYLAW